MVVVLFCSAVSIRCCSRNVDVSRFPACSRWSEGRLNPTALGAKGGDESMGAALSSWVAGSLCCLGVTFCHFVSNSFLTNFSNSAPFPTVLGSEWSKWQSFPFLHLPRRRYMMQKAPVVDLGIGFDLSGFRRMVPMLKSGGSCHAGFGDGLSICLDRSIAAGLLSLFDWPSIFMCLFLKLS